MNEKEYIYVEVNQIDQNRQETNGEIHCTLETLLNTIASLLVKTAKKQDEMSLRDMLKYIILRTDLELKAMEVSENQKGIDQIIDKAMNDLISRKALCDYALNQNDKSVTPNDIMRFPSAQPDNRLERIADIVEGTIDHLDRDDAMDMLYQIKEVLK